jgi:hypothetical protein
MTLRGGGTVHPIKVNQGQSRSIKVGIVSRVEKRAEVCMMVYP